MSVDDGEYQLLAGLRRVKAAQALGWTEIDVNIVAPADAAAMLNIKISENEQREPFTFSERDCYRKLLEKVERAKAKECMALGGKGGLEEGSPHGDTLQHGRMSSIVAGKPGMKKTTYDRAKYISEKASQEVIKQLDKGERTDVLPPCPNLGQGRREYDNRYYVLKSCANLAEYLYPASGGAAGCK